MNKTISIRNLLIYGGGALLLLVIGALVGTWAPWSNTGEQKTITLQGSTTTEVTPDEFVFYPSIEATDSNQQAAKQAVQTKGQTLADAILALGLNEDQLNSSLDVYETFNRENQPDQWKGVYRLTVTTQDKEQSDKVYELLSDNKEVTSGIDPFSQLSPEKRKEIENQARTDAIADARSQAEKTAQSLGGKIGEVVSFEDSNGFDVLPIYAGQAEDRALTQSSPAQARDFYSGTEKVTFTVSVTFELK